MGFWRLFSYQKGVERIVQAAAFVTVGHEMLSGEETGTSQLLTPVHSHHIESIYHFETSHHHPALGDHKASWYHPSFQQRRSYSIRVACVLWTLSWDRQTDTNRITALTIMPILPVNSGRLRTLEEVSI